MSQPVKVKPDRSRRCDCCAEPWKNAIVGALIVVLITKIVEANATIQNAIYVARSTSSTSCFRGESNYECANDVLKL